MEAFGPGGDRGRLVCVIVEGGALGVDEKTVRRALGS